MKKTVYIIHGFENEKDFYAYMDGSNDCLPCDYKIEAIDPDEAIMIAKKRGLHFRGAFDVETEEEAKARYEAYLKRYEEYKAEKEARKVRAIEGKKKRAEELGMTEEEYKRANSLRSEIKRAIRETERARAELREAEEHLQRVMKKAGNENESIYLYAIK